MNAVIYARYSSHSQTEASIEGQLHACYEFAQTAGYTVIREYIDRALTGTTDSRPQFQKMVADSAKRQFDFVLVYQLDRFARSREDSAHYKARLKRNGVRVISAKENISEDASGILVEAVLEGMAEYYSAELSQKVRRGIALSVAKCRHLGSVPPFGYSVDEEKRYIANPETAPLVKRLFELYARGLTLKETNQKIIEETGKNYFKNVYNSLNRIFDNKNYIGVYTRGGSEIQNGMPRLIDDELFLAVQHIRDKKKKTPASARAAEEYLLTTKLFCGYCREMMVGVSGTSKSSRIYNYYTCKSVWGKKGNCKKKNVRKDAIESFIFSKAMEQLTEDNIQAIARAVSEISQRENNTGEISKLKKALKENALAIDNLLSAIEQGQHMDLLADRITEKQKEKVALEKAFANEQMKKISINEEEIKIFLRALKIGKVDDIIFKRAIITIFVNAVYLYDDHATIIFNASRKPIEMDFSLLATIEENPESSINSGGDRCSYSLTSPPPNRTNANPTRVFIVGEAFAFVFELPK
jgi:DNA invertase Pin-like site-specific DNA recombinase